MVAAAAAAAGTALFALSAERAVCGATLAQAVLP